MRKTVVIVGAGASKDYGLPTAGELKSLFCGEGWPSHIDQRSDEAVVTVQQWEYQRRALARRLRLSGATSIDSFLEREENRDLAGIGKVGIAGILLDKEYVAVASGNFAGGWLSWIFREVERSACEEDVAIITFNYDRLIELGWAHMYAHSRNLPVAEALSRRPWPRLLHVYGELDGPSWNVDEMDGVTCYGMRIYDVAKAAKGIRLMGEERADAVLENAKEWVWSAQRIIFLGFGFDSVNLDRIGIGNAHPDWWNGSRHIYGSCFGLIGRERELVSKALANRFGSQAEFGRSDELCESVLRSQLGRLG